MSWTSILITVATIAAVGLGLIWIARSAQRNSAFLVQEKSSEAMAQLISDYVINAVASLQLLEHIKNLDRLPPAGQKEALESIIIQNPSLFSQLTFLDLSGTETVKVSRFHTFLPGELGNVAAEPAFRTAFAGRLYVSPVFVSPDSGLLSLRIALPVRRSRITGVLTAEVNALELWRKVMQIRIGQSGYAYLVDKDGRFVAYQELSTVLQRFGEDMRRIPPVAEFILGAAGDKRRPHQYRGLTNESVVGTYAPIAGTDWAVIVEWPVQEALAGVRRMQWYLIALGALGMLVAGGCGFWISRRLVRPMRALTVTVQQMAAGDLSAELAEEERPDEAGVLARAFRRMQAELRMLYGNLEQQVRELRRTQETLRQSEEEQRQNAARLMRFQATLLELTEHAYSDLETALKRITEAAARALPVERVSVWLFNSDRSAILCQDLYLLNENRHEKSGTLFSSRYPRYFKALENSRCIAADEAHMDPRTSELSMDYLEPFNIFSLLDVPIRLQGRIVGVLCHEKIRDLVRWTIHDQDFAIAIVNLISLALESAERRKLEAQLIQSQKMEAIGTLAGGLAHDFNNMLAGLTGPVSILKYNLAVNQTLQPKELSRMLDMMDEAGARAVAMVRQLLSLSRRHEITLTTVDLNQTLKSVMKICMNTLDKSIELAPKPCDKKAWVMGDSTQMEQVLLNLCINAGHAMTLMRAKDEKQGGRLSVAIQVLPGGSHFHVAHPEAAQGDYVQLSVQDTGVGMDAKTVARIFDPFFTTKEQGQGTGLGLAVAYNIVKQHLGFIDVYSEPGCGTTVNVYLPAYQGAATEAGRPDENRLPHGSGLILVVDDEEIVREVARTILEKCGYEVLLAHDGQEGVELFARRHQEIRAVVLDMVMPRKSGKDAFIEMQKIDPDLKVLLASGFRLDERVESVLSMGVKDFIQKPYSMRQLVESLHRLLSEP